jgi:choloylglycine hydrolase
MRILTIAFCLFSQLVFACTDFLVKTADGMLINGRSLEFGTPLPAEMRVFPRGDRRSSQAPDGSQGVEWTSRYGFAAATSLLPDCVVDGMNEAGLSFGALWLPGTQYQTIGPEDAGMALDFVEMGCWILGQFATVAEVKEALKNVRIWGHPVQGIAGTAPLHLALHDTKGKSLVVEFVKGEMKIYDNPNGVLTNYPTFDWQIVNLQNYLTLSPVNASSVNWNGSSLGPTGQGSGLFGIPGDWTPPSRFVRTTALLRFAKPAENAMQGVNLAEHLLNAVDIPLGDIREKKNSFAGDYTQWAVIKDLSNKVFYFRSYKDLALKFVDLKKLNFNQRAMSQSLSLDMAKGYFDVTASLRASRSSQSVSLEPEAMGDLR